MSASSPVQSVADLHRLTEAVTIRTCQITEF
jgi:hypothetical protein